MREMSRRLMDEHEAALTRQQGVYEAALHTAQQEKEHVMEQLWQLTQGNNQSQPPATDTCKCIVALACTAYVFFYQLGMQRKCEIESSQRECMYILYVRLRE